MSKDAMARRCVIPCLGDPLFLGFLPHFGSTLTAYALAPPEAPNLKKRLFMSLTLIGIGGGEVSIIQKLKFVETPVP